MQFMQVQSLCWEDPLEKKTETHYSILAWKINPMDWWGATAHGVTKESDMTLWLNNNKVAIEFLVKC